MTNPNSKTESTFSRIQTNLDNNGLDEKRTKQFSVRFIYSDNSMSDFRDIIQEKVGKEITIDPEYMPSFALLELLYVSSNFMKRFHNLISMYFQFHNEGTSST